MPTLFVLMPFEPDLEPVYDRLFRKPFEKAGYEVSRADDIDNQRSILQDIIQSIQDSDLVLADLTDLNPNVFYELGIAHAFEKPVVLVTQEVGSLPFDLQSYRVVSYSTNFAEMDEAVRHMEERARKIVSGEMEFASPVTDYSGRAVPHSEDEDEEVRSEEDDDERPGILDLQADLQENMDGLTALVRGGNERFDGMNERLSDANERVTGVELGQPRRQRRTFRDLGFSLETDAAWFKDFNAKYCDVLAEVEDSLVGLFGTKRDVDEEGHDALVAFVKVTGTTEDNLSEAAESFQALIGTIGGLPRIERRFDRGSRALAREIATYIDNIELSIAVITRARNMATKMLSD